jgi:hypothetical protein
MGDAVMDTELIQAFIAPVKQNLDIFADAQWLQIPDQNNGSYASGRLIYNTTNLRTQFVDYHNAYILMPFSVTVPLTPVRQNGASSGTAGYMGLPLATTWGITQPPNICFKSSVLDLIPGIQHSTDTGTSIINQLNGVDQINAWRLNVEHNDEWFDAFGPALCAAPDKFPNSDLAVRSGVAAVRDPTVQPGISETSNVLPIQTVANPTVGNGTTGNIPLNLLTSPYNEWTVGPSSTSTTTANPNSAAIGYQVQRNPYYNKGFRERCDRFRQMCDSVCYCPNLVVAGQTGAWQFSGRFLVPLKYLHDFWMQDQAPKINVAFQTFFQIPWANNASAFNSPFMTDGLCGNPVITMLGDADNSSVLPNSSGQGGSTYLYYRSLTFGPEDNKRIVQQITDGTWQTVDYIITQVPPVINIAAGGMINQNLTQAVAAPLRIIGFFQQSNALTSPVMCSQSSTVRLSGFNILINGTPLYRNSLQADNEFWQIMAEQFDPNTGSCITYGDYTFNLHTIIGDLQRLGDRLPSPNAPVSIQVVGTRNDVFAGNSTATIVTLQAQWYIESRQTIRYKINTASTDVNVGLVNGPK